MIFLALDPGLSGAFAAIDDAGQVIALHDLPFIRTGKVAFVDAPVLVGHMIAARNGRPARIYVERVGSMPGQGVASSFTFGTGFGSILAACRFLAMPLELVTPSVWKGALGLSKDKRASLDRARMWFPGAELHLAKHEGRGEALLLAEFARRQFNRQPVSPPEVSL